MSKDPVSAERKLFETWYTRTHTGAHVGRSAKGYNDNTTRVAWRAWQARAGVSEEIQQEQQRKVNQFERMAHSTPMDPVQAILKGVK